MKRLSRTLFLGIAPAVAAAASRADAQATALRVGSVPVDAFAQAYYAAEMGFFSKAGLNVEITTFSNGAGSTTAIAGGALDVGISTVAMMANATLHGVPLVYIAGGALYDDRAPTTVLCVAKDATLTGPKDFEGKAIAVVGLRDGTHLAAGAYLTKGGADMSRVSFIEMPFPTMAPALKRGTVAGAIIAEPFVTAYADDVRVFALAEGAIAPRFMTGGWFSSLAWVNANRDTARRFANVMYETARWANANHARSGEILQKYAKIDQATISRMTRTTFAQNLTPALLDPSLQWAARLKFTDRLVTAKEMIAQL
jgi:NitT/TauT family transport system substrate-binding protein